MIKVKRLIYDRRINIEKMTNMENKIEYSFEENYILRSFIRKDNPREICCKE